MAAKKKAAKRAAKSDGGDGGDGGDGTPPRSDVPSPEPVNV